MGSTLCTPNKLAQAVKLLIFVRNYLARYHVCFPWIYSVTLGDCKNVPWGWPQL